MARPMKPTAVKKLAGNPGKRPLPEHEPTFKPATIEPPDYLTSRGRKLWNKYALALEYNGMLNETNRDFLGAYCDLLAAFIEEREQGEPPCLKKLQQIRLMAREFGFTPSSQAGVTATPKSKDDGKSKYFKN